MRILLAFLIFCVAGCAEPPPLPLSSSTAPNTTNRVLYGMITNVEASERYVIKDACTERGALCDFAMQTARETEMATVDVMGKGSAKFTM